MKKIILFVLALSLCGTSSCYSRGINRHHSAQTIASYAEKVGRYKNNQLHSGSEIVSLCNLLAAYDYKATVDDFVSFGYITISDSDWTNCFYGSLKYDGWCFAPAIMKAGNNFLNDHNTEKKVYQTSNTSENFKNIIKNYIDNDIPVEMWITSDYQLPKWNKNVDMRDNAYTPYTNERAVVLYKVDKNYAYFQDPVCGKKKIDKDKFGIIYEACGCNAIYIEKKL